MFRPIWAIFRYHKIKIHTISVSFYLANLTAWGSGLLEKQPVTCSATLGAQYRAQTTSYEASQHAGVCTLVVLDQCNSSFLLSTCRSPLRLFPSKFSNKLVLLVEQFPCIRATCPAQFNQEELVMQPLSFPGLFFFFFNILNLHFPLE
jgi:hypothetical protein